MSCIQIDAFDGNQTLQPRYIFLMLGVIRIKNENNQYVFYKDEFKNIFRYFA